MKINCLQSEFKNQLALVGRAIPSRPTHPILQNVLIIASDDTVTLKAFDLTLGIESSFDAEVKEHGSVTLPAKLLSSIIGKLPEGEVTLTLDESSEDENPLVTIKAKSGKFELRGMKSEEFPELPVVQNNKSIELKVKTFKEGLQRTLFASSTDETKQVLTGLHLTFDQNTLEFATTDGHRLAIVKIQEEQLQEDLDDDLEEVDSETADQSENEEKNEKLEITLPNKSLGELEKILGLSKDVETLLLYLDNGQAVFELDNNLSLTSRTLDGDYPKYKQLLPKEFTNNLVIEREMLITSLERVAVLADSKNNLVRFYLDENDQQLTISVEAKELGNASETMNAQLVGNSLNIGFNIKYLLDGLKSLPSNYITFNMNNPVQPVVITPLNDFQMTYLIMPVQIRD